jgi:hypothetical protein
MWDPLHLNPIGPHGLLWGQQQVLSYQSAQRHRFFCEVIVYGEATGLQL